MHAYAFLSEKQKTPSKNTKISPKNLGRFAGIIEEWIIIYWELHEHVFDLSYVWKIQKYFLLFFVQKHLCNSFFKIHHFFTLNF